MKAWRDISLQIVAWTTAMFLTIPSPVYAQETVLSGTVTDATGGVLPGVTVTALHDTIRAIRSSA